MTISMVLQLIGVLIIRIKLFDFFCLIITQTKTGMEIFIILSEITRFKVISRLRYKVKYFFGQLYSLIKYTFCGMCVCEDVIFRKVLI